MGKTKLTLTENTSITCKGFDISIGKRIDQIAIISHSTGDFTPFAAIKKGGRLSKIKRKFRRNLCSSNAFFFEFMSEENTALLIAMLK
jgi:hypothetical protein